MKRCECFSPVLQWLKSLFQREKEPQRIIEIGPPTNFRKEEFTLPLSDDDATLYRQDSHGVLAEKEAARQSIISQKPSRRDQLRAKLIGIGAKLTV
ncbi:hypothetical protein BGW36DRAFT_428519 [Talaromyces proteolyticus]|uniref:Uncharacterized protein n=1 Tax=Talaromyces proteolyticus TaxID=1131652 RepID=A0AAD4PXL7_9EURO|nr:uncharacterized protein BGW36DRAFT_428519 [Talaromyces proteolyticus]KAH8696514.1 hypothetical protein BGW36DRAFT_428519 [Talaromyces proteolyticus]